MEYELGAPAKAYTQWAAQMAVGLGTGVPWIMCKQDDAPDPIVSSTIFILFFGWNFGFLTRKLSSFQTHYLLFSCDVPPSLVGLLWDYMLVLNDTSFLSHAHGWVLFSLSYLLWSVFIFWSPFEFCADRLMTISPCLLKLSFCFESDGLLPSENCFLFISCLNVAQEVI